MIKLKSILKKNLKNFIFFFQLLICFVLLINGGTPFLKGVNRSGHTFFSFFQLGITGVTSIFAQPIKTLGEFQSLKDENQKLKEQLLDYKKVKNENLELHLENRKLLGQLDFAQTLPSIYDLDLQFVPAMVVARQPGNFFSSFTISKGSLAGIKKDMSVVAHYENFQGLVGKVVAVGLNTSIVMPIFNNDFFAAARFQGAYYEGLVNGFGESSRTVIMRYVNKQAKREVKYGDLVVTSGLGQVFPEGIHIGTIKKIMSKTYETSMEIELEPVIDFSKLEYVFVLNVGEEDE